MPTPNDNGRVVFTAVITDVKFDASGDPEAKGRWTFRGHAAVYNRLSHDLGGYRVKIDPAAFDKVLDGNPDVHLVVDHDTRWVLARTRNNSLELRADPYGLHVWARFAKTQTADEIATLLEGGFIDQMSFACDIGAAEWSEDPDGNITQTILEIDALYDVTICAQGAFPQTDAQLVASMKDAGALLASAREAGLVAAIGRGEAATSIAQPETEAEGAASVAQETAGGRDLTALKEWAEACFAQYTHPE
jgi:HK97 family phage prohead protease